MSGSELQVAHAQEIIITQEQKELVKRTIAPDATDSELQLFFYDNTRRGVHPLDKLIHFTKRNGKYTPITSIDMFRMRAAESGEHLGTDDAVYLGDVGKPEFAASVTVYRHVRGEKCPFSATARWSEYFPGEKQGFMWQKMPHLMLAKCAEALALRKAFPQQLHGLYTPEEMAQAERPATSIPQVRPQVGNRTFGGEALPPAATTADRYTGEPETGQEDGAGEPQVTAGTKLEGQPQPSKSSDAPPAQSAAEFCKQRAAETEQQYEDGFISKLSPYQGTKAYQKGVKPGYFDLEDGTGQVVRKFKIMDPDLDTSSGLKRVYYRTEVYQGKTSYAVTKIESLE